MPNPTPQPDIDELREKVEDYLDRADTEKVVNVGQFADEIMKLLTTHTEKAVSAAREDNFIAKLQTYSITDQQLILGGLIYKYFMLATNATKVTMTLSNFSHKDKVLGDLVIKATLQATTPKVGVRPMPKMPKNDIQAVKGLAQLPNAPTRWPKGGEDE